MDRALFVISALLLNALLGHLSLYEWFARQPAVQYTNQWLALIERKLNREHRSPQEREMRGWILIGAVLAACLLLGAGAQWLLHRQAWLLELVILTAALPARSAWERMQRLRTGLQAGDPDAASRALDSAAPPDEPGIARAGIELLAVHFSEKILAPALWYMAFGLPGLCLSKAVWWLQRSLAKPGHAFGRAASAVHYWLHYVPSRLNALLWIVASLFLPSARIREAVYALSDAMPKSPPDRLALQSAAAVLHLSLGGPHSPYAHGAWLGGGSVKPLPADLKRAQWSFVLLCLLFFLLTGLFA